jgi:prepilin-type N-terminal cleavage/methylation domain-containing protein
MRAAAHASHHSVPMPIAFGRRPTGASPCDCSGFTLIELMVALALAAIISVSIMFISSQARLAYDGTVKKVDVYSRFRFALKSIENDIKNWIPTSDLEFYTDGRGRGSKTNYHWDPGEELPDRKDDRGPGVVDGGIAGQYDEYAQIVERHYVGREKLQAEDKRHAAFQLYFRTVTFADGAMRVANVEYMLVDPNYDANNADQPQNERGNARGAVPRPPRKVKPEFVQDLTLIKIVRYQDISFRGIQKIAETPIQRRVIEVASNVTDFSIDYLVDREFRGRANPDFRTPEQEFSKPSEVVTRPRAEPALGVGGGYRKIFGYGTVKLGEKMQLATGYPERRGDDGLTKGAGGGAHDPLRFGFRGNQEISFAELVPGDKIFVFKASSRGQQAQGAAAQSAGNANQFVKFPDGDFTVKTNLDGLLEFNEDIDSTGWNGQPQTQLYYKAAYIPGAVRVTLRMVDDNGENPKTLQREIWLRRRSR